MNRVVNFLSHTKFVVRLLAVILVVVLFAIFVGVLEAAASSEPVPDKTAESTGSSWASGSLKEIMRLVEIEATSILIVPW